MRVLRELPMTTSKKKMLFDSFSAKNCIKPNNDPTFEYPIFMDIKELIEIAGWSQREVAEICGVTFDEKKGSSTVRKWCSASEKENRTIPYTAWRLLLLKSNLISLNDEAGVTLNKPVNSKSALVTIKGKKDITRYRLTFNEAGCIASPFQEIVNEYRLNLMAIPTFQFFDEIEYEYVMPELLENFGHAIVMAIGSEYEVLCFKKSAAGEYHRVKREIDEYFEG
jgi:transcriptional regulator with XRE-family HTH domain